MDVSDLAPVFTSTSYSASVPEVYILCCDFLLC